MRIIESVVSANLIITPFIILILAAVPALDKRYGPTGRECPTARLKKLHERKRVFAMGVKQLKLVFSKSKPIVSIDKYAYNGT